jgi:hypothetical protein
MLPDPKETMHNPSQIPAGTWAGRLAAIAIFLFITFVLVLMFLSAN